jgi:hypothetical protein
LTAAIALARRGVRTTVFERDDDPERMPRFNPDRSYPIDLTGHGLKAVRHIDALAHFDAHLTPFHGISGLGRLSDPWSEPGWIGSRGDITRALMSVIDDRHRDMIGFGFHREVRTIDVHAGEVAGRHFDLVIGADGAGSAVLLGDDAAAFPPVGQGGNAALESAMVLDQCLVPGRWSAGDRRRPLRRGLETRSRRGLGTWPKATVAYFASFAFRHQLYCPFRNSTSSPKASSAPPGITRTRTLTVRPSGLSSRSERIGRNSWLLRVSRKGPHALRRNGRSQPRRAVACRSRW